MASARENDLNPDIFIGLKLPFNRDKSGLFGRTQTTLEQAGSNIKNLLLTAKGERVMQPNFGSRLRELLFEQYTEDLTERIKQEIQEAMSIWLPYIDIAKVDGAMDEMIKKANGKRTIPQIFFDDQHIGGYVEVRTLEKENKLKELLK